MEFFREKCIAGERPDITKENKIFLPSATDGEENRV